MITAMMSLQAKHSMFDAQRKKATFNSSILSELIYDSKDNHQTFLKMQAIVDSDPILRFDPTTLHRSRSELIDIYAHKLIRYNELFPPGQHMNGYKNLFFDEQLPLGLHDFMFMITLRNLCDSEQVKTILQPAERGEILGCYAQTELGHGSDVQGLMTTATYDVETQEFVLNTPEVKAAKWWIGDLGIFCTHACVFAQLIIKGKNHGVHAFVVPIRDKQHKPFPGLEVGDIGPKLGFQTKDNGYLIMKNYRIPRQMMLMKFHKVSSDGTYAIIGNEKITYATMLMTRSAIPFLAYVKLSRANTVITRYSLYRRQFKDNKGVEMPVLDYQLQQEKVFPRIAESFAILFAFKSILEIAKEVLDSATRNVFDRLQEAHVITSSIKALATRDGLKGLQILRRAGGGHAFSTYSGIPMLQNELTPAYTFQGQYTILHLQVARYLLKNIDRVLNGKPIKQSVAYIAKFADDIQVVDSDNSSLLTNPDNLITYFQLHSLGRIKRAAERIQQGMQKGMKLKNSFDQFSGLELVDAATAHGYNLMVKYFWKKVNDLCTDAALKEVLTTLFQLYAVDKICEYSMSFFETGVLGSTSLSTYRNIREELLVKIRPNALAIVQAFDYSDNTLHTAIGRKDGQAYETLFDWAKHKNDVNNPKHAKQLRIQAAQLQTSISRRIKANL